MDTQVNEFVFEGSLIEFHALAQVLAKRYNTDGRWMECGIFAPEMEGNNLQPGTYAVTFHFAVYNDENYPYTLVGFFVEALQLPGGRTHLTCKIGEWRKEDWEQVLLLWLDLLGFLVEHSSKPDRSDDSETTSAPDVPPPWDRLATKDRWNDEDWIYFFDCLVPKSNMANVTPNFKALSDMTRDFASKLKSHDYIKKKYYQVYLPYKNGHK